MLTSEEELLETQGEDPKDAKEEKATSHVLWFLAEVLAERFGTIIKEKKGFGDSCEVWAILKVTGMANEDFYELSLLNSSSSDSTRNLNGF